MHLVQDYFLRHYSYISLARAKRPQDFTPVPPPAHPEHCVFCPGQEETTPAEIGRIDNGQGSWSMRWFPNKFSAVAPDVSEAYGHQEVIVETPDPQLQLWDLSAQTLQTLGGIYQERVRALSQDPGIAAIAVFKNHGKESGASLVHSHTQIIASAKKFSSLTPIETYAASTQQCPYCQVIAEERANKRVIAQNDDFIAFCSKAPRYAMEAWIVATHHEAEFLTFTPQRISNLMSILSLLLGRLKTLSAAYCFSFTYLKGSQLHFHLELVPRLHVWGGFELASADYIIGVPPEDAARFYRGE